MTEKVVLRLNENKKLFKSLLSSESGSVVLTANLDNSGRVFDISTEQGVVDLEQNKAFLEMSQVDYKMEYVG